MHKPVFAGVLLAALLANQPALADQRTDFYLELQQREECAELGGTLDGNKCRVGDANERLFDVDGENRPFAAFVSGGCTLWFLFAYVKPGENSYTLDGWYEIETTVQPSVAHDEWDRPKIHDNRFPLYFFASREDGSTATIDTGSPRKSFTFEGETLDMFHADWTYLDVIMARADC